MELLGRWKLKPDKRGPFSVGSLRFNEVHSSVGFCLCPLCVLSLLLSLFLCLCYLICLVCPVVFCLFPCQSLRLYLPSSNLLPVFIYISPLSSLFYCLSLSLALILLFLSLYLLFLLWRRPLMWGWFQFTQVIHQPCVAPKRGEQKARSIKWLKGLILKCPFLTGEFFFLEWIAL